MAGRPGSFSGSGRCAGCQPGARPRSGRSGGDFRSGRRHRLGLPVPGIGGAARIIRHCWPGSPRRSAAGVRRSGPRRGRGHGALPAPPGAGVASVCRLQARAKQRLGVGFSAGVGTGWPVVGLLAVGFVLRCSLQGADYPCRVRSARRCRAAVGDRLMRVGRVRLDWASEGGQASFRIGLVDRHAHQPFVLGEPRSAGRAGSL